MDTLTLLRTQISVEPQAKLFLRCYLSLFFLLHDLLMTSASKGPVFLHLLQTVQSGILCPSFSTWFYTQLHVTLGGQKQNLVCTRTQEKGEVIPQETNPDLPVSVQESLAEAQIGSGWCRVGGTECGSVSMGPFEGGCNYLHTSTIQTTGREHSLAHQQKIGLNIYWAWSHPSDQDPVSPSVSLSHWEAPISLLSFSIAGQMEWKPQSQETNQTDHMDCNLV